MGLFARKKCQRCRTPLRAGRSSCPYCGFDPAQASQRPGRTARRGTEAAGAHEIDDAPTEKPDAEADIAPEAAPWTAPDTTAEPWKTPAEATARQDGGPWQTRTDGPAADAVEGPWGPDRALEESEPAPEAMPSGGPWRTASDDMGALERMVRDNPKLNPVKKPNKVAWAAGAIILVMVVRTFFGG